MPAMVSPAGRCKSAYWRVGPSGSWNRIPAMHSATWVIRRYLLYSSVGVAADRPQDIPLGPPTAYGMSITGVLITADLDVAETLCDLTAANDYQGDADQTSPALPQLALYFRNANNVVRGKLFKPVMFCPSPGATLSTVKLDAESGELVVHKIPWRVTGEPNNPVSSHIVSAPTEPSLPF